MHDLTPHAAVAAAISLARHFWDVHRSVPHIVGLSIHLEAARQVCRGLRPPHLG
jgi:hypothetical protein